MDERQSGQRRRVGEWWGGVEAVYWVSGGWGGGPQFNVARWGVACGRSGVRVVSGVGGVRVLVVGGLLGVQEIASVLIYRDSVAPG